MIWRFNRCQNIRQIAAALHTCAKCQFLCEGRRDSADASENGFSVCGKSLKLLRRNFQERDFVLCRRVLINHAGQNLPHAVHIEADALNRVDNLAACDVHEYDVAVLAHDFKYELL